MDSEEISFEIVDVRRRRQTTATDNCLSYKVLRSLLLWCAKIHEFLPEFLDTCLLCHDNMEICQWTYASYSETLYGMNYTPYPLFPAANFLVCSTEKIDRTCVICGTWRHNLLCERNKPCAVLYSISTMKMCNVDSRWSCMSWIRSPVDHS